MEQVAAFDLDGTLSESELFLLPAYQEGLRQMGETPLPDHLLRQMIGGTIEDNHQLLMPERPMAEYLAYSERVSALVSEYLPHGRPYPGVIESLVTLRAKGCKIALCSNGERAYVYQVLDALGLTRYFDFVQHLELGCNKSDLLGRIIDRFAPAKVVMVGDRCFDVEAARANHVPVIGCLYGLFPDEVRAADVRVTAADQISEAVNLLIG